MPEDRVVIHDNHGEINIGRTAKRIRPSGIPGNSYKRPWATQKRLLGLLRALPPWREMAVGMLAEITDMDSKTISEDLDFMEDEGLLVSTGYSRNAAVESTSPMRRFWRLRQPKDDDRKVVSKALEHTCPRCKVRPGKLCKWVAFSWFKPKPEAHGQPVKVHGDRLRLARGR